MMEPGSTLVLRGEVGFTNGYKLILDEGVYVCVSENFALSGTEESPFCVNGAADKSVLGGVVPVQGRAVGTGEGRFSGSPWPVVGLQRLHGIFFVFFSLQLVVNSQGSSACVDKPDEISPMKLKTSLSLFCALLVFCALAPVRAQSRQIKKADTAFRYHMYDVAVTQYQKAFARMGRKAKTDPDEKNRLLFQIAESYRYSGRQKSAARQYQRCIRSGYYKVNPGVYFHLANLQLAEGDFDAAISNYETYLDYIPDDSAGIQGLRAGFMARRAASQASRYQIENVRKLNTNAGDWTPRYYDAAGTIVAFSSTREGVTGKKNDAWTGQRFSDIFVAKQDAKGGWSQPEKLDQLGKTSTPANESDASFCKDGMVMYYTYCGSENKKRNRCVIKTSVFDGKAWGDPVEVIIGNDSVSDFVHPFITEDGSRLFFASNREGGYGDLDIWYAEGSGNTFSEPVNVNWRKDDDPDEIRAQQGRRFGDGRVNSPYKEAYPYLRNDTLLYFASTGHGSMGGYDIFRATLREGVFVDVENLGYPVNTNADDFGICFVPGQNKGLFSSNRGRGRGSDDIYSFYMPDVLFTISGTITDETTLQPVSDAEVTLAGTDGMLVSATTDAKGFYMFNSGQVNENTTYKLIVEKRNYLGAEGTETTVGLVASKDFEHDFTLAPMPRGPVVLPEILYDLGKWDLKEQYQDSLMGLIVLLEKNPRLVIELASHTDSRPIAMTNDSLSQYRAQSVVDYLIKRGIDGERLVAKGYGSHVPRTLQREMRSFYQGRPYLFDSGTVLTDAYISSLKERNMQEAAHQLNRRTEFSVLREDFIPSGNRSISALVGMGDWANANKIPFDLNPDDKPEVRVIANGMGMRAVIDAKARTCAISVDAVMRLLQVGNLGKNSFKNKERAFNAEGEVLPGQHLQLKELKMGKYVLQRLEFVTAEELPAEILLNATGMGKIGSYSVDKESRQIVVEE